MKTYLIKVDMKDVWQTADTVAEAIEVAAEFAKQHPDTIIGTYRLISQEKSLV